MADCVFQKIGPFHLGFQICDHRVVHSIPLLFFSVHEFCTNKPSFISDVICFLSFFLIKVAKGLLILLIFFKEAVWGFIDFFSIECLSFTEFYFNIYFLLLIVDLIYYHFASFLREVLLLLILELYYFYFIFKSRSF